MNNVLCLFYNMNKYFRDRLFIFRQEIAEKQSIFVDQLVSEKSKILEHLHNESKILIF